MPPDIAILLVVALLAYRHAHRARNRNERKRWRMFKGDLDEFR